MQKLSLALLVLCFLFFVCACGVGGLADTDSHYQTVVDSVGREVQIPAKVQHIAALDTFSAELLIMIGAGEKLSAMPRGIQANEMLGRIFPQIGTVAVVQQSGAINTEALMALDVDVILVKSDFYFAQAEKAKLEQVGLPFLVIDYCNMEQQIEAYELVGKVAGEEYELKSELICSYYQDTVNKIKAIVSQIPAEERRSVYHSINEVVRCDGGQSLGADWTLAAACDNVSALDKSALTDDDYYSTPEQIFVWDPDYIICNEPATVEYLKTQERWRGLRAVYEDRVLQIPVAASRWGQKGSTETFFALMWLAKTVYPSYFTGLDLQAEVINYYRDIIGQEITLADYEQILTGEWKKINSKKAGG